MGLLGKRVDSKINRLKKNKKFMSAARVSGGIVLGVAILFLGIGIGNGTVKFGADGAYRKALTGNNQGDLSFDGVEEIYSELRSSYDGQLDVNKLEDGIKKGLVEASGDPFTEYLNQEESKEFDEQLTGSFEGIGAELGKEEESIVIIAPLEGFPAAKAGLKPKDIITKINDERAFDLSITEAVRKIRGPKDTKVKLEVIRDGRPLTFEITRDQIDTPSVKWEVTNENIGIMTVTRFGEDTPALAREAAEDFKSKNVRGVVLDMRGNPGGVLDASVRLSSLWLPNGKIVLQEKRDNKVIKTYRASGQPLLLGVPTIVLVDEGSASASEITAGALKDNDVATIIGTTSFGKGSVQELRSLRGGGVLKVTIAHWYTPSGRNIDKEGIEPDQKVEISEADVAATRDPQKEAAVARLR